MSSNSSYSLFSLSLFPCLGTFVVEQILSGRPREEIVMAIHDYLSDLSTRYCVLFFSLLYFSVVLFLCD